MRQLSTIHLPDNLTINKTPATIYIFRVKLICETQAIKYFCSNHSHNDFDLDQNNSTKF